jgi:hypothetical protein
MSGPQWLKSAFLEALSGTGEEAAEKVESATSAAKAADGDKGLIAALKRCATQKLNFSAACEAVPYPKPFMRPVLDSLTLTSGCRGRSRLNAEFRWACLSRGFG